MSKISFAGSSLFYLHAFDECNDPEWHKAAEDGEDGHAELVPRRVASVPHRILRLGLLEADRSSRFVGRRRSLSVGKEQFCFWDRGRNLCSMTKLNKKNYLFPC